MNKLTVHKSGITHPINETANPQSFNAGEPAKSWEIWHRRFGHIRVGMSSLQQILDEILSKDSTSIYVHRSTIAKPVHKLNNIRNHFRKK